MACAAAGHMCGLTKRAPAEDTGTIPIEVAVETGGSKGRLGGMLLRPPGLGLGPPRGCLAEDGRESGRWAWPSVLPPLCAMVVLPSFSLTTITSLSSFAARLSPAFCSELSAEEGLDEDLGEDVEDMSRADDGR